MAKCTVLVNPESGTIDRIFCNGNIRKNVGKKNECGYIKLKFDGGLKSAHNIIWSFVYGQIPNGFCIDHINGIRHDNRISNLRLVTHKQNSENQKNCHKGNISGTKGVYLHKQSKKWIACISHSYKKIYLGIFPTIEEADEVYCLAASMLHTHNPCAA